MAFTINTPSFSDNETIPGVYTCDNKDISPRLTWRGEPASTRSFALVMHDPDAPVGDYTHWIVTDIPANVHELPEHAKKGSIGVDHLNSWGNLGYSGPCPPRGHGTHRYFFELTAVDVPSLGLPEGSSRAEVDAALKAHMLDRAITMGTYQRK